MFESIEFLSRLATVVPRPRGDLVRCHDILAPNAKHRSAAVPNRSQPAPLRYFDNLLAQPRDTQLDS